MKLEMQGKGMKIGPQLERRITEKLAKFQNYFDDSVTCQVKCSTDSPETRKVEITLYIRKHIYRAERTAGDVFTALDLAVDVLEGQIRKHKTKIEKNIHDYAYMKEYLKYEVPDEISETSGNGASAAAEPEITAERFRHKSFELRPMTKEEAALQMELLGHTFFLYENADTERVNLVYKRHDGNYGVIEPDYED